MVSESLDMTHTDVVMISHILVLTEDLGRRRAMARHPLSRHPHPLAVMAYGVSYFFCRSCHPLSVKHVEAISVAYV